MMPYDTYRLHQIQRAKTPREIRRADEQAAQFASAVSRLFQGIMRPARAARRPRLAAGPMVRSAYQNRPTAGAR